MKINLTLGETKIEITDTNIYGITAISIASLLTQYQKTLMELSSKNVETNELDEVKQIQKKLVIKAEEVKAITNRIKKTTDTKLKNNLMEEAQELDSQLADLTKQTNQAQMEWATNPDKVATYMQKIQDATQSIVDSKILETQIEQEIAITKTFVEHKKLDADPEITTARQRTDLICELIKNPENNYMRFLTIVQLLESLMTQATDQLS